MVPSSKKKKKREREKEEKRTIPFRGILETQVQKIKRLEEIK